VRSDEQAALLAAIVDIALGAASGSPGPLRAEVLASSLLSTVFDPTGASFAAVVASGVRTKVLTRLAALIPTITEAVTGARTLPASESASSDGSFSLASSAAALAAGLADAARVARSLLASALPEALSVDASSGIPRWRGVAANGRVLALAPLEGGVRCVVGAGGADATPSAASRVATTPSLTRLGVCVGPLELATLAQHERGARGAAVSALLASPSTKFHASIEPDDLTAEWMSGLFRCARCTDILWQRYG
jgi:hypothetical protein